VKDATVTSWEEERGGATALGIPKTPTWDVCQQPGVCLVLVYLNVTGNDAGHL